jgi:hypothetical protein
MARYKRKLCRMCKERPVWRGGDVKDPGPFCKTCYHRKWRRLNQSPGAPTGKPPFEPDYEHCPECGVAADVCGGGPCPGCGYHFENALYRWFVR